MQLLFEQLWPFRVAVIFLCAIGLAAATGCASPRGVQKGEVVELAEDEGLLIVHLESDTAISRLAFNGHDVMGYVEEGSHYRVLVVGSGNYKWTSLSLPKWRGNARLRGLWKASFRVEPGVINFVGTLQLSRWTAWYVLVRQIDRSAEAARWMMDHRPELVSRYPMVYSGEGRNVFFDHFRAAAGLPDLPAAQAP